MADIAAYKKQLDVVPQEETLTPQQVNYLNRNCLTRFLEYIGVDVTVGGQVPESGGAPRMFILDEKEPNRPRSLAEAGVEAGSARFWELAQQGKLFAFPSGQKDALQIQVKGGVPPEFSLSEPLSPDTKNPPSSQYEHPTEPPKPMKLPKAVARPGFFARMLHGLNKNWYKKEHEAYSSYLEQRRSIETANRVAKESYDQEVAAARQALDGSYKTVSEAITAAFGAGRTPQVLQAEIRQKTAAIEEKSREKARQELEADTRNAEKEAARLDTAAENMISIYGPRPKPLERLTSIQVYSEETLSTLKPITLPQGLAVGNVPVDDRLFANIAMHAQLEKNIATQWYSTQNNPAQLLNEGLSQEQVDELLIHQSGAMLIGDILKTPPRPKFENHFPDRVQPGRERAEQALLEYRNGNKAPLAEIIAQSAKYLCACVKENGVTGETAMADAKMTGELLDLLDQDPELRQAAAEKGLDAKTVELCRGLDEVQRLSTASLRAQATLLRAQADGRELSEQEKTQLSRDIIKYNTVMAMQKEQAADYNSKNLLTVMKRLEVRGDATVRADLRNEPMPEGVKPLAANLRVGLTSYYRYTLKNIPSAITEVAAGRAAREAARKNNQEPQPDTLDKITDMTVQGLGLGNMTTAALAQKLAGKARNLTGSNLLAEQGKLLAVQERIRQQQEAERKREQEMQEKLNNAMDMGHGGKPG